MHLTNTPLLPRLWHTITAHKWKVLGLFVAVLLPLIVFGVLAEDVLEQGSFFFDDPLLLSLHSAATPFWDTTMLTFSRLGYGWGVVPLDIALTLLLIVRRHHRDALFFGLSVGGAALLNQLAKTVFGRQRPTLWESIAPERTMSFPSGHAMGAMALAAALIVLLWPTRWRYPMLLGGIFFTLMVGFSRIYLGVHYPSDVLAGWAASLAWVMGLSTVLYGRIGKPSASQTPTPSVQAEEQSSGAS